MNPARKRKLIMLLLISSILAAATSLVLYALRQNISLFYSPTQIASGQAPLHHTIHAGGMVVKGSVIRGGADGLSVQFKVTDFKHTIAVDYHGILPTLFREGQGIVARGQLADSGHFNAIEVLAKHDENYMPPAVKDALAKAG